MMNHTIHLYIVQNSFKCKHNNISHICGITKITYLEFHGFYIYMYLPCHNSVNSAQNDLNCYFFCYTYVLTLFSTFCLLASKKGLQGENSSLLFVCYFQVNDWCQERNVRRDMVGFLLTCIPWLLTTFFLHLQRIPI